MKQKVAYVLLLFFLFIMCYPYLFLLTGSLMGENELLKNLGMVFLDSRSGYVTWSLLPKEPNLWSYVKILLDSPEFLEAFWNTIRLAGLTLVFQCIVNIPAAWGLSIYTFRGRKWIFWMYFLLLILPFQVLMLPQYLVLNHLGLFGYYLGGASSGCGFSTVSFYCLLSFSQASESLD